MSGFGVAGRRMGRGVRAPAGLLLLVVACSGTHLDEGPEVAGGPQPPPVGTPTSGGTGGTGGSGGEVVVGGTGGVPTGGSPATGAQPGTAGDPGIATGGEPGTTGSGGATSPPEFPWMEGVPGIGDLSIDETATSCTPPCGLRMVAHEEYLGGGRGATLFIDLDTGEATLRQDPLSAAPGEQRIYGFTYESNQYGYGAWTSTQPIVVFTQNYGYDMGYSTWTDEPIRSQVYFSGTDTRLLVIYSFEDVPAVRIHEVRVVSCNLAGTGPCENPDDCPAVESGTTSELSPDCGGCYAQIVACSAAHCAADCPGQGGNACLHCETDANCHTEFMTCSGLDYLPAGTVTLPNW